MQHENGGAYMFEDGAAPLVHWCICVRMVQWIAAYVRMVLHHWCKCVPARRTKPAVCNWHQIWSDMASFWLGSIWHIHYQAIYGTALIIPVLARFSISRDKGRQKKINCFFLQKNSERGAGGSRPIQNFLIRKNEIFLDFLPKGGGGLAQSKRVLSEKNEIFGHILPKRGDFVRKNSRIFRNFWSKGGGSPPIQNFC